MFNVYYINYAKAFEIAMQMDNKVLEQTIKDKGWDISGGVHGDVDAKQSFLDFLLPKLSGSVSLEGSKTTDTIKVVSTKSTVLAPIVKKATEVKKLDDNRVGNLIKIKNVQLAVHNGNDMLAAKVLMSGFLDQIPIDGIGSKDLTGLVDAFLKGASYILTGKIPEKVKTEKAGDQIILDPLLLLVFIAVSIMLVRLGPEWIPSQLIKTRNPTPKWRLQMRLKKQTRKHSIQKQTCTILM